MHFEEDTKKGKIRIIAIYEKKSGSAVLVALTYIYLGDKI